MLGPLSPQLRLVDRDPIATTFESVINTFESGITVCVFELIGTMAISSVERTEKRFKEEKERISGVSVTTCPGLTTVLVGSSRLFLTTNLEDLP